MYCKLPKRGQLKKWPLWALSSLQHIVRLCCTLSFYNRSNSDGVTCYHLRKSVLPLFNEPVWCLNDGLMGHKISISGLEFELGNENPYMFYWGFGHSPDHTTVAPQKIRIFPLNWCISVSLIELLVYGIADSKFIIQLLFLKGYIAYLSTKPDIKNSKLIRYLKSKINYIMVTYD